MRLFDSLLAKPRSKVPGLLLLALTHVELAILLARVDIAPLDVCVGRVGREPIGDVCPLCRLVRLLLEGRFPRTYIPVIFHRFRSKVGKRVAIQVVGKGVDAGHLQITAIGVLAPAPS